MLILKKYFSFCMIMSLSRSQCHRVLVNISVPLELSFICFIFNFKINPNLLHITKLNFIHLYSNYDQKPIFFVNCSLILIF